jgi:protein-tyrosine phosphatase
MIDLHAHVLPGIDDGPATMVESLALLQVMARQGIKTVVAAAHALDDRYNATRAVVEETTRAVNAAAQAAGMTIQVLPGMELYLGFDTIRAVRSGEVIGVNGSNYLVVELPPNEFPLYTERALFELMIAGYRPILNHPERNRAIRRKPELMYRLAEKGIGAMVTAASLLGRFGTEPQTLAERFLADQVATMIVSDAHDLVGRAPLLPEALLVARTFGKHDQAAELHLVS